MVLLIWMHVEVMWYILEWIYVNIENLCECR
jgi:hypothetical protein